jgi:conjugative transfer signal peptidase TraF
MTMNGRLSKLRDVLMAPAFWPGVTVPGVLLVLFPVWSFLGLRVNTSPSLPVGLYIATTDASANLVEFCPAEPSASLSIARGYRESGTCSDGAAPLLKPIVAGAGDNVELSKRGISVNGVLLPNTAPLSKDIKGRPLQSWPYGHYSVAPGTVWVASTYHPRSFDSRYFGPVSITVIRDRLRPFLTL